MSVEEFVESLFDEANKELKEVYQEDKKNRDEILKVIANIMLTYTVLNEAMKLPESDKIKQYKVLSKLIKGFTAKAITFKTDKLTKILKITIKNTFNHYSYNANLKDIKKIVDANFEGKHFSERVWAKETDVAERLLKQVKDFVDGKVGVNQIKKDIEKTFNSNAYNAKRLAETEVSRVHYASFTRFCKETDVKKLKYNATLDSKTCSDCASYHGKSYDFGKEITIPRHPLCRCFYEVEE